MNRKHNTSMGGFTMVELLVALVLGLMLSAGIVNVYLENKSNYAQDEEIARLQENARYALDTLNRELTMAGHVAGIPDHEGIASGSVASGGDCVSSGDWALDVSGDMFELISDVSPGATLTTINGTTWSCLTSSELEDGTDLFSIKRSADRRTLEDGSLTTDEEDEKQWYLRAEDGHSNMSWFYLDSGELPDKTAGNAVDYWEFYSRIFFIRDHSRTAGDGIPTLCVESLGANTMETECLVEGVEDMQIEVGIDVNDDSVPDQFKPSPSEEEIEQAVAVRVYLLVRSVNSLPDYTNDKKYHLGSKTVNAKNDGYIRRVFSTTVQMRNAKLPNA